MGAVAQRAEALLGAAVVATTSVAGGDICTATRLRLSNGSSALIKTRPHPPDRFFEVEAAGLRWLAESGTVAVPEVLAVEDDCIIEAWVETGRPSAEAAEAFGRTLAALHLSGSPRLGAEQDGYIGLLPLPNKAASTWPEFYVTRRVLPYLRLARDRGGISAKDAADVEAALHAIASIAGPDEPPARLHGDLWSGNVLWGTDSRVWLIDPAAHGGHRETDLAMLTLFGCPQLSRVLDSYNEVAPLAEGWEQRVPLHQLFPLMVHACHFGGASGYGARAGEAARRAMA